MSKKNFNTKQKGNIGIGCAIAYFTKQGCNVSLPLNDSQDYDLIVDNNGTLLKIQVKFTTSKVRGSYKVYLRSISGSSRKCYKTVKNSDIDVLFIVTEEEKFYLVKLKDIINMNSITLNKDMDYYLVS